MQRASQTMSTDEHQRWMRRTVDQMILLVIVVAFAVGAFVVWHNGEVNAERHAQQTVDCIAAGRSDC